MSDAIKPREADPWWGATEPAIEPEAPTPAPAPARAPRGSRRSSNARRRSGPGWLVLGVLVLPFALVARLVRRSPRLQRLFVRLAILTAILGVLACSVGVILINNLVVGRTAELGELEDRRRELRRDNALLGADKARLEAASLVFRRAENELGMVATENVPDFVFLHGTSRTLDERQRQRVRARAAAQRQRAEAASRTGKAQPGEKPATATPGKDASG